MLRLLLGLGNPGPRYEGTRHNVGFEALDRILAVTEGRWTGSTSDAVEAETVLQGRPITLMKPLTYMNRSGGPAARWVRERGASPSEVLVYLDDVDLPLGTIRLRPKGGSGGHRGLASLLEELGAVEVPRLRIGIGTDDPPEDLAAFVLAPFDERERPLVEATLDRVAEATSMVMTQGISKAMSRYNAAIEPKSASSEERGRDQGGTVA